MARRRFCATTARRRRRPPSGSSATLISAALALLIVAIASESSPPSSLPFRLCQAFLVPSGGGRPFSRRPSELTHSGRATPPGGATSFRGASPEAAAETVAASEEEGQEEKKKNIPTFSDAAPPSLQPKDESSRSDEGEGDRGVVSVRIERTIPGASVSPSEVRDAWIEQHWKRGGGLPIFVINKDDATKLEDHGEGKGGDDVRTMRRVVAPIMMEETLSLGEDEDDAEGGIGAMELTYTVSDPGPVLGMDVIPGSHSGAVTFEPLEEDEGGGGCRMTWEVRFETARLRSLYHFVTEFTVGTAATTVAESAATPRLLTCRTTLDGEGTTENIDAVGARREWLEFFWRDGGGLPVPPAFPYGDVMKEGGGRARRNLLRVPPFFMVEKVLKCSESESESECEVVYRVENPGWASVPFLMHTHLGRARFVEVSSSDPETGTGGGVDLIWEIEIRPFRLVTPLVEKLVEMTMTTIARNCRVRLAEPGAAVRIKPPRGGGDSDFPVREFGSVPKETWLGGVLDAHLTDKRDTWEQSMSLLQPWTWGRTGTGDKDDVLTFSWSDGHMSS